VGRALCAPRPPPPAARLHKASFRKGLLSDYLRRGFCLLRLNVRVLPFERREA
jgi:hypothetical protein